MAQERLWLSSFKSFPSHILSRKLALRPPFPLINCPSWASRFFLPHPFCFASAGQLFPLPWTVPTVLDGSKEKKCCNELSKRQRVSKHAGSEVSTSTMCIAACKLDDVVDIYYSLLAADHKASVCHEKTMKGKNKKWCSPCFLIFLSLFYSFVKLSGSSSFLGLVVPIYVPPASVLDLMYMLSPMVYVKSRV